jgi:uncharacterized membrane protein
MTEIINSIRSFLGGYIPPELIVFIISLTPVLELRGGLIVASLMGVPWGVAAPIAVLGNIIPVPFIIFFIERILGFLKEHGPIRKFAAWVERKGRTAGEKMTHKHPKSLFLALLLFVAVPLPGTGAWTGSLAAALLGLEPKRSMLPICLGVLGACAVMSALTYFFPALFGFNVSA